MKFIKYHPTDNDERVVKFFALFPITVWESEPKLRSETRWLEMVTVLQRYKDWRDGGWSTIKFVDQ